MRFIINLGDGFRLIEGAMVRVLWITTHLLIRALCGVLNVQCTRRHVQMCTYYSGLANQPLHRVFLTDSSVIRHGGRIIETCI